MHAHSTVVTHTKLLILTQFTSLSLRSVITSKCLVIINVHVSILRRCEGYGIGLFVALVLTQSNSEHFKIALPIVK